MSTLHQPRETQTDVKAPAATDAREPWGWTRRQRIGLGILLSLLLVFLAIQFIRRPFTRDDTVVTVSDQHITLPQRIDPNTATLAELARIPHLGEATAEKIIAYREARKSHVTNGIVFRAARDLDPITGIGPKLIEQFESFLIFPDDSAADTSKIDN